MATQPQPEPDPLQEETEFVLAHPKVKVRLEADLARKARGEPFVGLTTEEVRERLGLEPPDLR